MTHPYEANELQISRTLTRDSRGVQRGTRVWEVHSLDGTAADESHAVSAPGLPIYGDNDYPSQLTLSARTRIVDRVPNHPSLLRVTWMYEEQGGTPPGLGSLQVGYVETTLRTTARPLNVWRRGVNTPNILDKNANPNNLYMDIGGTPVDVAGRPTSILLREQTLVITEITTFHFPDLYMQLSGKRNNTLFQGANTNEVLYTGANSQQIRPGIFSVNHEFVRDLNFHLIQLPLHDQYGRIALTSAPGGTGFVADEVYLRQPFPDVADLNDLSFFF